MNEGNYREYGACCYFHPKEVVLGVCHLCLNERLLILSAKQGVKSKSKSSKYDYYHNNKPNNKAYVNLPKLFAIASFFHPKDHFRHHRHRHRESDVASTSVEEDESFISIKFGDNGVASWDKTSSTVSKVTLKKQHSNLSWGGQTSVKDATIKSVVEHAKPRTASLRWRKRIGQLLQLIRWNKSSKATNAGGGNNSSKVVVRNNNKAWIKRKLKSRIKE